MTEKLGMVSPSSTFLVPVDERGLQPPRDEAPTLAPWLDVVSRSTQDALRELASPSPRPEVRIALLEAIDGASQALHAWKGSDAVAAGLRAALDTARVASKTAPRETPAAAVINNLIAQMDTIIAQTPSRADEAERYLRAAIKGLAGPIAAVDPETAKCLAKAATISYVLDYANKDMLGALAAAKATLRLREQGGLSTALVATQSAPRWWQRLFR